MAGRPREFDEMAATDDAMQLFWSRGFEATSLQDLIDHMDLSKSSFYQTFGSKHDLFQRCLVRYQEIIVSEMRQYLARSESGAAFIRDALAQVADETRGPLSRRGCLLMNTAAEFAQRDPSIAARVASGTRALCRVFREAVVRAQEEGNLSETWDPDALAHYLVTTVSGLKTMVKAGASRRTVLETADIALAVLD